jgi:DNA-binding IclR family transcriptional regulator
MSNAPVSKAKTPRGIQSATVGLRVLKVLADGPGPLHLREIAAAARMDTSNVYRYLVSFAEAELVVQGGDSRYDLGPFAIQIGLAALNRIDGLDLAIKVLGEVVQRTDLDGHISVFGSGGATVVRWRGRPRDVVVRVSEGTVLPLLTTATGRIWGAYLEPSRSAPILKVELDRHVTAGKARRKEVRGEYEQRLDDVRRMGLSLALGERRAGIDALSGPVFDGDGSIAFVMTLVGPPASFDSGLNGQRASSLRQSLFELSRRLGAGPEVLGRYPWSQDYPRRI